MGCGNPKEKLEDEMMKIKMSRIEIQMERHNQLKLLKSMNEAQVKTAIIPDYIDRQFLQNHLKKKIPTLSLRNTNKEGTLNRRARRFKSSKVLAVNKKSKIFNFDEEEQKRKKLKRRYTYKRKTFKF